jgi:NAD(P)-dependent dehydrogenase (short-subunit alcohol dehydrogenase family)
MIASKVVIVTGRGKGIGAEIAQHLKYLCGDS